MTTLLGQIVQEEKLKNKPIEAARIQELKKSILDKMAQISGRDNKLLENEAILENYISKFHELYLWAKMHDQTNYESLFNISKFPLNRFRLVLSPNRYNINGNTCYWTDWFYANAPFYTITAPGNIINGSTMSTIKLTSLANDLLFGNQETTTLRMVENFIKQYKAAGVYKMLADSLTIPLEDCILTPINLDSLIQYMDYTATARESDKYHSASKNYKDELDSSLISALMIYTLATGYMKVTGSKTPMLVQVPSKSEFGRTYLTGINLQSCSKIVREAALGTCHQYDISASVFTWKNDETRRICESLNIDFKPSHTLEYLDSKDKFRRHIAKLCFPAVFEAGDESKIKLSIKSAKQILTSVGFGATAKNNCWRDSNNQIKTNSIREIVGINNTDNFNRLINDPDFSAFMKEQETITNILVDYHLTASDGKLKNVSPDINLKTKSKKMAYLYQQAETELMEFVIALACDCDSELKIILTVHDAIYTNKPIDGFVNTEVQKLLSPSFKFDHSKVVSWKDSEAESQADIDEREHREFIRQQEVIAKSKYVPEVVEEPTKPAVDYSDCESLDDIKALDKEAAAVEIKEMLDSANPFVQAKRKWGLANSVDDEAESARRRAILSKFSKKTDVTLMAE